MLHYKMYGSSTNTIVLLHGFCENNTCFNEQVFFLKDHYKVITIDLPGFGNSEVEPGVTIDQMAKMVQMVLVANNIEKCLLFGHSMGGYVALSFANQFNFMLLGLGLINSTAAADTSERKEKRKKVIEFLLGHGKEAYIKSFIPGLFLPENQNKPYVNKCIIQGIHSKSSGIIEAAKAMMKRPNHYDTLAKINLPVYFGVGMHDAIINPDDIFEQAARCNIAKVVRFNKTAHMCMFEEPELLNNTILSFADYCVNR